MTAQKTADVIANAREAVAKGNADYLERTIVALADERDGLAGIADEASGLLDNWADEDDGAIATRLDVIEIKLKQAGRR